MIYNFKNIEKIIKSPRGIRVIFMKKSGKNRTGEALDSDYIGELKAGAGCATRWCYRELTRIFRGIYIWIC